MFIQSVSAPAASPAATEKPARVADAGPRAPVAPDEGAVRHAAAIANDALRRASSTLEFTVEQDTGKTIVRVIDQSTHEVIRQIPSEEMIAIAREIDRLQGLLLKGKA